MTPRTITQFLATNHAPQRSFCGPWLRSGELVMLFAPRGTGKSLFCTSLALSLASGGSFLGHKTGPARVLVVDAETSDRLNAKRYAMAEAASATSPAPENLSIWSRDAAGDLPNFSTPEGQFELEPAMLAADVVIIDNLLTAAPPISARDDDVRIWYRIKPFIYRLRNADKCVLIVHHAGKSGQQMGTSLRENDMDIIIRLTNPPYTADQKLAMYMDFEKARDLAPADREPLYLTYETIDGLPQWTYRLATEHRKSEIRRLAGTVTNKMILAQMVGCPVWFVHQALKEDAPAPVDSCLPSEGYDDVLF